MAEIDALLRKWEVPVARERFPALNAYYGLLKEWNRRMDLTSVPDEEMPARHFLDSLLPLKQEAFFLPGSAVIDVGTGAGFPGLALAAARPDLTVTLLDAQQKRCVFLQAVADALQLGNVRVIQGRAEVLGQMPEHRERYDLAVARAVAGLNVLCEYLLPFVKVGGWALCWKGPAIREEMPDGAAAAAVLGGRVEPPVDMDCADLEGQRLLVPVFKKHQTVPQYPRKNGMPAKRPLKADKK